MRFVSLDDAIDTSTAAGRLFMQIRGAFAEYDLSQIRERTQAGREAAMRRGTRFGRPSTLSPQQRERILRLRSSGQSVRAIARTVGASKSVVGRALRLEAAVPKPLPHGASAYPATPCVRVAGLMARGCPVSFTLWDTP